MRGPNREIQEETSKMQSGRIRSIIASIVVLCSGMALASGRVSAQGGNAGAMSVVPATKVIVFHPAGTTKSSVKGNCDMSESAALDRADAWRCAAGNIIYDPCFSAKAHATTVICDATPLKPVGITLTLSKPLPTHLPAHGRQVWFLKLGDGTICSFLTGATGAVSGQRLNYGCTNQNYVLGDP
ncbi:MAG: hypothetical protein JWO42_3154, partial [Chloroflexi bacterium]|nr:hypothetical protein [Chloroflexota bacterium]